MCLRDSYYGTSNAPVIVCGRYGLGSKDTTPAQIIAVFKNLAMPMPKNHFTIGIVDDVTFTSPVSYTHLDVYKRQSAARQ